MAFACIGVLSACSVREPRSAPGFKPDAVDKLRIGLSRAEVAILIGAPLSSSADDQTELLEYATPGETWVLGRSLRPRGFFCAVFLRKNRLSSARLENAVLGSTCTCTDGACGPGWAGPCLGITRTVHVTLMSEGPRGAPPALVRGPAEAEMPSALHQR